MKLLAALLVVTPFLATAAHAAGDGDGDRRGQLQRSIYEVAAGDYSHGPGMYEGRSATMSEPREDLGPGATGDPEYFRQESESRE